MQEFWLKSSGYKIPVSSVRLREFGFEIRIQEFKIWIWNLAFGIWNLESGILANVPGPKNRSPNIIHNQILICITTANQISRAVAANQHRGRQWPTVVVKHLRQRIGATVEQREHLSGPHIRG